MSDSPQSPHSPQSALSALAGDLDDAAVPYRTDADLGSMTTYRVGGRAALLVEVEGAESLDRLASLRPGARVPVTIMGKGSNTLVSDAGFAGVAVVLGDGFSDVAIDGTDVVAGGAVSLPVLARFTAQNGLCGFEWAVGVPGTIGGAVRMNAGGHGSDMSESVRSVRITDLVSGQTEEVGVEKLGFGYRSSRVLPTMIVVDATLELDHGDPDASGEMIREIVQWRRRHQPGGANAGSVFTNPPGESAGRLIDAAGCKDHRIGTAAISGKHANFIQADPGGSASDVLAVMAYAIEQVHRGSGIRLEPETRLVGFSPRELERVGIVGDPNG